jgi:glycosyltransferase involved in cell wall biosynthesis
LKKGIVPISIIPTGPLKPSDKRDIALKHAKGQILAFLDDDAYPVKEWLKAALVNFSDPEVAAVGGPAVTPLND